ncbi:MAG: hypothetical protein PF440_10255 [Thiomicrorhabdus sp.]|nr:hypothetical protein [Thiomicrorhabdus sp.]
MADSYILTVEKALTTHIETEVAGGLDLTGKVFRGRDRLGRDEPLPMVTLLQAAEIDESFFPVGDGAERNDWKVYLIQGFTGRGPMNTPTDSVHPLLAEVKRILAPINDFRSVHHGLKAYNISNPTRGIIADIQISTGLVRPPDADLSPDSSYFWLPVRLNLVENLNDPYALP